MVVSEREEGEVVEERAQALQGSRRLVVRVRRVQAGCTFPPGAATPPFSRRLVVGRSPEADFQLDDPSISARHVTLAPAPGGLVVENHSRNGSTFLNEDAMAPGQRVVVHSEVAWLQVGRALLEIASAPTTIPVHERLELPPAPGSVEPLLTLRCRGLPELRLAGRPASLYPAAARVLARLCESPGEVVAHAELRRAMDQDDLDRAGGGNVAQAVTYVRDLFARALAEGVLSPERLGELLVAAGAEVPGSDPRALLRQLVRNVRGVGYRLDLPAAAIRFV